MLRDDMLSHTLYLASPLGKECLKTVAGLFPSQVEVPYFLEYNQVARSQLDIQTVL